MPRRWVWLLGSGVLVLLAISGCQNPVTVLPARPMTLVSTTTPSPSPSPSLTWTASPSATLVEPSLTPSQTPIPEPAGCLRPPDDYTRVEVNGMTLNKRTLAMLEHAASLYKGEIEITGFSITQGSFRDEPGSFGTHNGGGVLDLSVMRPHTYTILKEDLPSLVRALRLAGFAAWLRQPGEVFDGSAIHIHAVAVGDKTLSPQAKKQINGPDGYFAGFTANPGRPDKPVKDPFGGPIVCAWMKEDGLTAITP